MTRKLAEKERLPELSGLEVEIMNIVWELGECSSAEVIARCRRKRPLEKLIVRLFKNLPPHLTFSPQARTILDKQRKA